GYKKGAFTGANSDSKGIMLEANGGTVFLDEIGDITPYMQALLLRFLQNFEFLPVGGTVNKKTNVRIIAATNKNLLKMCKKGKFRWDLYYRLAVAIIEMPKFEYFSSNERIEFINYFLEQKQYSLAKSNKLKINPEAKKALLSYSFPGNFRELENLIEQLYVFTDSEVQLSNLPDRIINQELNSELSLKAAEKKHIAKVLAIYKNNLTHTYKALGLGSVNTLKSKIKEYKINIKN
ncbi:MAG: sigma-54-dependent Fis family transcriptional regulator, partial [Bacteroidales bacterium]|nr:sigma-54-dependent Fis family transcriptional regulator [Bacteroidales bacterium]